MEHRGWPSYPPGPPDEPGGDWVVAGEQDPATPTGGTGSEQPHQGWAWRTAWQSGPPPPATPQYETPYYETPYYETPYYEAPQYEAPQDETTYYEAIGWGHGYQPSGYPPPGAIEPGQRQPPAEPEPRGWQHRAPQPGRVYPPPGGRGPGSGPTRRFDPDPPPERANPPPSLWWTLALTGAAFIVPVLVYLGWAWSQSTTPRPGCVDATGAPCLSPRAQAMAGLVEALPALAAALGLALLLALVLRRLAFTWRSHKIAFAAAVISAGMTTLLVTVLP